MPRVILSLVLAAFIAAGVSHTFELLMCYIKPHKRFGPERDRITQELNYKEIDRLSIVSAGSNEVRIARCYAGNRIIFESPIKDFYIDGNGNVNIKRLVEGGIFITKAVCVIQ